MEQPRILTHLSPVERATITFRNLHIPWPRGNTATPPNVLLCQFLPNKGMDLSAISRTRLNDIARLVNGGPRLVLDARLLRKT